MANPACHQALYKPHEEQTYVQPGRADGDIHRNGCRVDHSLRIVQANRRECVQHRNEDLLMRWNMLVRIKGTGILFPDTRSPQA